MTWIVITFGCHFFSSSTTNELLFFLQQNATPPWFLLGALVADILYPPRNEYSGVSLSSVNLVSCRQPMSTPIESSALQEEWMFSPRPLRIFQLAILISLPPFPPGGAAGPFATIDSSMISGVRRFCRVSHYLTRGTATWLSCDAAWCLQLFVLV